MRNNLDLYFSHVGVRIKQYFIILIVDTRAHWCVSRDWLQVKNSVHVNGESSQWTIYIYALIYHIKLHFKALQNIGITLTHPVVLGAHGRNLFQLYFVFSAALCENSISGFILTAPFPLVSSRLYERSLVFVNVYP